MNKDYQKPEVEFINLTAMENITTDGDSNPDPGLGDASSIW